jgi:hypothetical protein
MRSNLSILVLVLCLITSTYSYGVQLSMPTVTTASITNFYQDFSYCSCDLSPSLCDNYCCCDGACSTVGTISRRPQWQHGLQLAVVSLLRGPCRTFATKLRPKGLEFGVTWPVFISPTGEKLGTIISILMRHLLPTLQ